MTLIPIDKWKRLFRIIRQHGGIFKSLYKLCRMDTLKDGRLVGWDTWGNRYYVNNYYMIPRNRWVEFHPSVALNYDASQISADWHGWLHHKTDKTPCEDQAKRDLYCNRFSQLWLLPHEENLTGTDVAYYPYSTCRPKIYPWDGSSIYSRGI